MSRQLAEAHIRAQKRLRDAAVRAVSTAWQQLPAYNEQDVPRFLNMAIPAVTAAQRQSALVTNAYLARAIRRPVAPLDVAAVTGPAVRAGTPPEEVYRRPFVTVWTSLKAGNQLEDAIAAGLARAAGSAAMDVQLTMRATLQYVGMREDRILGYARVPDGDACNFCQLISGQRYTVEDLMPVHNNCVAGSTSVWAASPPGSGSKFADLAGAHAATRRWYAGEVVVVETAAGYELAVTPNHPVLTDRGWIAAGFLREGDCVVSSVRSDGVVGGVPDEQHRPARVEECFGARSVAVAVAVPFASEQFHGDRGQGEVDVVSPYGHLDYRVLSAVSQPAEQHLLALGFGDTAGLPALCPEHDALVGVGAVAPSGVRGASASRALLGRLARGADDVLLGRGPQLDSMIQQMAADSAAIDAVSARQLQDRLAGSVQLDSVRHARRVDWSGHVYNLVTSQGWYTANGIVTHNCGCGVDVITADNRGDYTGVTGNDLDVAVAEHGELGPLLVGADHAFTTL